MFKRMEEEEEDVPSMPPPKVLLCTTCAYTLERIEEVTARLRLIDLALKNLHRKIRLIEKELEKRKERRLQDGT